MRPTFSVVIPVYNGGSFLREAVASVLRQTLSDLEVIVVDDGSTDDAAVDLRDCSDPRLRIIRQSNQGPAAATNRGLDSASGQYLAFLDQDDVWAPRKLERHLECFETHADVDLNFTWFSYIGENGQDLGFRPRRWRGRVDFEQLLCDNVIGATSPVAIRSAAVAAVGPFDTALPMSYDLDLFLRVLRLRRANAIAIPEVLTMYRRHPDQMSGDWRALQADWQALLAKYRGLAPNSVQRHEKRANTVMCHYFASVAYERREFAAAWTLLSQGLQRDPAGFGGSPRHWRLLLSCLAARVLPGSVHQRLERMAGLKPYAGHDLQQPR